MSKLRTAFITSIVNVFEWYDYALFGLFAQIIGNKFFPSQDPAVSLLSAFLVFAVGYIIRPIGGLVFGVIGDKFGRKVVLSSSVICMSIPTFIVGILPSYETIGFSSTVIMVLIRLLQGLAIGGALTGSVSFIVEHTEPKHKGFAASLPMAGICVGILLGSSVAYVIKRFLTEDQFNEWGWRIPFLLAILIMFVGLYIRKYATETPEFNKNKLSNSIEQSPIKYVFNNHKLDILISIFLNATGSILFYFQVIYIANYLKMYRGIEESFVDQLINFSYILMAAAAILGGYLSDKFGRTKVFGLILLAIVFLVLPMTVYFINGNLHEIICAHIVLSILAAFYIGVEPALQCELYPSNIRNTALSLAYNFATTIFGGTTPYVMQKVIKNTASLHNGGMYILCCGIASLIALKLYANRLVTNKVL
jgi:MHS family proline/betaine transporter-like MFS transporter